MSIFVHERLIQEIMVTLTLAIAIPFISLAVLVYMVFSAPEVSNEVEIAE
jgi:hypothetical protein